jgi:hypothetical protein
MRFVTNVSSAEQSTPAELLSERVRTVGFNCAVLFAVGAADSTDDGEADSEAGATAPEQEEDEEVAAASAKEVL